MVAVIVLGLLAALAIPRFSQGAAHDPTVELRDNLALLRPAIAMYYRDHGQYPCQNAPVDLTPGELHSRFVRQLTRYTDAQGVPSDMPTAGFQFGPYLRESPTCPVSAYGGNRVHVIGGEAQPAHLPNIPKADWVFNRDTGYIAANSEFADATGIRFDHY